VIARLKAGLWRRLEHFRDQFEHTFVSTAANCMQPATYYSVHPTVTRLHSEIHPVRFDIRLLFAIVQHIETDIIDGKYHAV